MAVSYDQDFYSWTQDQARLLLEGRFDQLDLDRLADEVADMGKSEIREFKSRLAVIIAHLLKLAVQTHRTPSNERSWRTTIDTQRQSIARHLAKNPGLKNPAILDDVLADAWGDGRVLAIKETGLDPLLFPEACPYSLGELLEPDTWP